MTLWLTPAAPAGRSCAGRRRCPVSKLAENVIWMVWWKVWMKHCPTWSINLRQTSLDRCSWNLRSSKQMLQILGQLFLNVWSFCMVILFLNVVSCVFFSWMIRILRKKHPPEKLLPSYRWIRPCKKLPTISGRDHGFAKQLTWFVPEHFGGYYGAWKERWANIGYTVGYLQAAGRSWRLFCLGTIVCEWHFGFDLKSVFFPRLRLQICETFCLHLFTYVLPYFQWHTDQVLCVLLYLPLYGTFVRENRVRFPFHRPRMLMQINTSWVSSSSWLKVTRITCWWFVVSSVLWLSNLMTTS